MASFIWGMIFGVFGLAYLSYGKRQSALMPLVCGLALILFPYFVSELGWMIAIGAALVAAPWIWR